MFEQTSLVHIKGKGKRKQEKINNITKTSKPSTNKNTNPGKKNKKALFTQGKEKVFILIKNNNRKCYKFSLKTNKMSDKHFKTERALYFIYCINKQKTSLGEGHTS